MFTASNIQYELSERRGHRLRRHWRHTRLVRKLGFADAIDRRLRLLKLHLPYQESDHVLNFLYNAPLSANSF
jgi:hypothetical protein